METLKIQRTRQLFAFNQYVNLFLDGKFCGKLGNGDRLSLKLPSKNSKLEVKSCFGNQSISIYQKEAKLSGIVIQYSVSDLYFLAGIMLFIIAATLALSTVGIANISFSTFIFVFSGFFIIRNRKKLRIIKKTLK